MSNIIFVFLELFCNIAILYNKLSRKTHSIDIVLYLFFFFNRLTASRHLANMLVAWPVLREMRRFSSLITRIRLTRKEIRYIVRNIKLSSRWKHGIIVLSGSHKKEGDTFKNDRDVHEVSAVPKKIDHSCLILIQIFLNDCFLRI